MSIKSNLKKIIMRKGDENFDLIIEPHKTTADFLRELIKYRELFFFIAWRDILVRYKQTVVGTAWSVIKPLFSMVIFTVIFGRIAKMPSEAGVPYPIMVFSAILPWNYFSGAMGNSSGAMSISGNGAMISKIYFPRIILPTSAVFVNVVDFAISFVMLCILMLFYGFLPSPSMLLLPVFFIPATMTALGVGYFFAAIGVKYRDFHHLMPFIMQMGMYVSPVGFSSSVIPDKWRLLYSLNPMVGVIDGFRWCIQGTSVSLYTPGFIISIVVSIVVFIYGAKFFRATEKSFADYI